MDTSEVLSCHLIGGDSLLMECGNILARSGIRIDSVFSRNPKVASWAKESGFNFVPLGEGHEAEMQRRPVDYLFAITHLEILPESVLRIPRRMCINFHDGPLPGYAGLNAPAWALINRETEYGITWHEVTAGIDEGRILCQERFDIAADETSLSLNTKCFAAGLNSFPGLLEALQRNEIKGTSQDLRERTYYARYQRPEAACVLDWNRPAVELAALIRALDFGNYANPLGVPKILLKESAWIVKSAVVREGAGNPGTVLGVDEQEISVATADGILVITTVMSLDGQPLGLAETASVNQVTVGTVLPILTNAEREELSAYDRHGARHEGKWLSALSSIEPATLSFNSVRDSAGGQSADYRSHRIDAPAGDTDTVVSAFLLLLHRTGHDAGPDIFLEGFTRKGMPVIARRLFARTVPAQSPVTGQHSGLTLKREWRALLDESMQTQAPLLDLAARQPDLEDWPQLPLGVARESRASPYDAVAGSLLTLVVDDTAETARFVYDGKRINEETVSQMSEIIGRLVHDMVAYPDRCAADFDLLSESQGERILVSWNKTDKAVSTGRCIHELFEDQVRLSPEREALVYEDRTLTYAQLNARSDTLAAMLETRGAGADIPIGIYVDRSPELVIAALGVLKSGSAYVPLDPAFPENRIRYMIDDAEIGIIVTTRSLSGELSGFSGEVVLVDTPGAVADNVPATRLRDVHPKNLAYVIYTSGSTGKPKGVSVEHRNVVNFFAGMDDRVSHDPPGVWLAVTSLSFDISVLELFWTLTRGFKVVIYHDRNRAGGGQNQDEKSAWASQRPMAFGLFMWGNDDAPGSAKYRLMLDGARYFDENGFDSVWTPERHFHAFGGPYPNPAVTGAALAATTKNLSIRAGSCVSPLHHAIRIAEDWSVIDNLSDGRVGLSFASGWQPNDFVIRPENHKNNKAIMLEQIETVRKLWRGEEVAFENPLGDMVGIRTLPRPVQKELPVWVTTAGNPETYRQAGAAGANVLTHLLGQSVEELAEKIKLYRKARSDAGLDPRTGQVSVMLHTFVGRNNDAVRELVRQPMKDYLRSAMKLVIDFAWSFPAFKRPQGEVENPEDVDIGSLSEEEVDTILDFAFERYFETSGLFGTPENCLGMIDRCKAADIDEIACLLDYGVHTDAIMDSLPYLKEVRDRANAATGEGDKLGFADQVERHRVTHMQCTPSMARMFLMSPDNRHALKGIRHLLVGGEALPSNLADELLALRGPAVSNMYGPTETTIWSTTQSITAQGDEVTIGRPIANTTLYILDRYRKPVPPGVPGELFIGGQGVVRGYFNRPDLTRERFIDNPFVGDSAGRLYRTGDLASFRQDGVVEFHGRIDHQVKVRGYRIELGEIERVLEQHPGVRTSVVILREDSPGDQRLTAYFVADSGPVATDGLRQLLRGELPEYMVPADYIQLESIPTTPNGKVDRNSLPAPSDMSRERKEAYVAPEGELERKIVGLWQKTLKLDKVGTNDNFFDLGGHSLLVVRLHGELRKLVDRPIALTDLYRFPTVNSLVGHLASDGGGDTMQKSSERAEKRKQMRRHRRR